MHSAEKWLKEGGLLLMHVPQEHLQRAMCQRPPLIQFNRILVMTMSVCEYNGQ
jgi:hypothetical protein